MAYISLMIHSLLRNKLTEGLIFASVFQLYISVNCYISLVLIGIELIVQIFSKDNLGLTFINLKKK